MRTITSTKARENLFKILKEIDEYGEPIKITGIKNNAVLISENDWSDIQETLYLLSMPNMRESIIEGLSIEPEQCQKEPGW